jgi:hypothetical protein
MGGSLMIAALPNGLPLAAGAIRRAILAGTGWGAVMGIGLPALAFFNCGTICLSEVAVTSAISIAAGIVTIGPLAAFDWRARDRDPVRQPV